MNCSVASREPCGQNCVCVWPSRRRRVSDIEATYSGWSMGPTVAKQISSHISQLHLTPTVGLQWVDSEGGSILAERNQLTRRNIVSIFLVTIEVVLAFPAPAAIDLGGGSKTNFARYAQLS